MNTSLQRRNSIYYTASLATLVMERRAICPAEDRVLEPYFKERAV